ncbi:alpha-N-methyltransferase NTM1 [Tuber brumale]|nr:alpha-N-methyltransferase NTM1 [Tuber brumale]
MAGQAPPDALIDAQKTLEYWNSVDATPNGMLGGFESVSRVDLVGSRVFIAKLKLPEAPITSAKPRVADCGAGIGRITKGFLSKLNSGRVCVDIVEPVKKFTDQASVNLKEEIDDGRVGEIYNVGLENWVPEEGAYWVIWNQWCLGHLQDQQLVNYLERCMVGIVPGGVIVVKENIAPDPDDIYDEADSSVTRTDPKLRTLFKQAGLKVVRTEVQRGLPKKLYQVRSYALKPF